MKSAIIVKPFQSNVKSIYYTEMGQNEAEEIRKEHRKQTMNYYSCDQLNRSLQKPTIAPASGLH